MRDAEDMYQVVMHPALAPHFEAWLDGRGLKLFTIPLDDGDDLPTRGITPKEWPR